MIQITVTGIDEIVQLLQRNINDISPMNQMVLNEIADIFVDEMRQNAHVITGRMKGSIYRGLASDTEVVVGATAPYAVYENARSGSKGALGTHDFATRAFLYVQSVAWNIVVRNYNKLFTGTIEKQFI
jgi:Bacteriophage HK97-gp10, putative tail-component